tara:strand:- start:1322 stop:1618 length:297 start_codon:yes stop_codon:yes gene_type:complete
MNMGKWAGYCAKCGKWRTWEMAGKPSGEQAYWVHHRLKFMKSEQPELEEVKSWAICKKLERVGTQWIGGIGACHDPSMDKRCEEPLQKSKTDKRRVKV